MRVACPAISSSSNSSFPLYLLSSVVCEVRHCVIISILPPHLSLSIQAFGRHYCLSPTHHFHTRIWSPVLSVCLLHTTSIHAFGRQYCLSPAHHFHTRIWSPVLSVSYTPLPYTNLVASTVCLSPAHYFHTRIWSPVLSVSCTPLPYTHLVASTVSCTPLPYTHLVVSTVCRLHTISIHAFGRQYCLSPAHHFHVRIWSPVLCVCLLHTTSIHP